MFASNSLTVSEPELVKTHGINACIKKYNEALQLLQK
jgi:hypothetical protein